MTRFLLLPLFFLAACAFAQTSPLNDTGRTQCFEGSVLAECTAANTGDQSSHPRQDGRFGRDAQDGVDALTKIGSGEAGFDFTKIANNGSVLPVSATLGTGPTGWACTRDNVTGLIWEVKTPANAGVFFTFAEASDYATTVNGASPQLCGETDWRVPTRRELLSIVHHGRSSPTIDPTFFPNTPNGFYWSSDIYAPVSALKWIVSFNDGTTSTGSQTLGRHVRLVSGPTPPEPNPRFVDNLDGTVTDPATGLMWDRCAWRQTRSNCSGGSASTRNWQAALGIAVEANGNNHLDYNDWRLPNRTELESLVDITTFNPAIDTNAFPNTPSGFFWSSTVYPPSPAVAWRVVFTDGVSSAVNQTSGGYVRLVRSGLSFDALAGVATQMAITTPPSLDAQSGVPFPQQPIVEVQDTNGDAVLAAGTNITAAIASGEDALTGTTMVATDANGRATFTDLAISGTVGDRTLSFSAGSLTPATSGTITLSAGPAAQVAINDPDNTNNQSAVAGTDVATEPSVIARDANGNPVSGVAVTFVVVSGGGSVTGASATTNASGIAAVGGWTLSTTAGTNTLTATSGTLTGSPLTFTATGTAGAATQMVINAGDGQSATGGTAVAVAPSVRITDANDNPVEGVSVNFAVASGGGSVTGTVSATNASGIAEVGGWTLGTTAGTNTLTASATGLADVTFTASSTTVPAAPTSVTATAGNEQATVSWTAGSDGGSPITGYTVTGDPDGSCSVAGTVTECSITGLTNGTEYTFMVTATNSEGTSEPSAASNAVTPATQYAIGGTVSGLKVPGLVIDLNNSSALLFEQDSPFVFPLTLPTGETWTITTPFTPDAHECLATPSSGQIESSDVLNVAIVCESDVVFSDGYETLSENPIEVD